MSQGSAQQTEARWYYSMGGQSLGPVTQQELGQLCKHGTIRADTYLLPEGGTQWVMAGNTPLAVHFPPPVTMPHTPAERDDLVQPPQYKHSLIGISLLTFLFVGLGHVVMGQTIKGLVFIVIGFCLLFSVVGILVYIPLWVFLTIDAIKVAKKLNRGQSVGEWEFLPR